MRGCVVARSWRVVGDVTSGEVVEAEVQSIGARWFPLCTSTATEICEETRLGFEAVTVPCCQLGWWQSSLQFS